MLMKHQEEESRKRRGRGEERIAERAACPRVLDQSCNGNGSGSVGGKGCGNSMITLATLA